MMYSFEFTSLFSSEEVMERIFNNYFHISNKNISSFNFIFEFDEYLLITTLLLILSLMYLIIVIIKSFISLEIINKMKIFDFETFLNYIICIYNNGNNMIRDVMMSCDRNTTYLSYPMLLDMKDQNKNQKLQKLNHVDDNNQTKSYIFHKFSKLLSLFICYVFMISIMTNIPIVNATNQDVSVCDFI